MQLLTHYSLFRSLSCASTNRLTVQADGISMAISIFGVSRTIALDILMSFARIEHTTGHNIKLFMARCFFLLIYFLVVEDYELPKNTFDVLSLLLTL